MCFLIGIPLSTMLSGIYSFVGCASSLWSRFLVRYALLAVIVKLNAPSPLLLLRVIPPALQDTNFATSNDNRSAIVGLGRPEVFSRDGISLKTQFGHRPIMVRFRSWP